MRNEQSMGNGFLCVELAKERIIYQLISLEKNCKLLKHMPHRIIGEDLAIVFVLLLENNHLGMATIKINKEHMNLWEMNEEELWDMAKANTPKLLPATFVSLKDVMLDLLKTQLETNRTVFDEKIWDALFGTYSCPIGRKESQNLQLYILSNSTQAWGASAILYPGVLKEVAKKLGGDLLILPSSVHETIILRREAKLEYNEIAALVKEINQKEVLPEDVLSDSVYLYHSEDDSFCRVAGQMNGNCGKDAGEVYLVAMKED